MQHAHNPVDWYAWNEEAFEKAQKENKPIFLSIGYSTCHWCHVMAHESFEDEEVAKLLNQAFVSIKVDREERPDIDMTYMQVAQMMTGGGGWPLTIIMTPDKKPFYADTYIPKHTRYNKLGLMELVPRISNLWKNDQSNIQDVIERVMDSLKSVSQVDATDIGKADLDEAYKEFLQSYDSDNGGFGRAPKFPSPHNLLFLLRYWKRTGEKKALDMVEKTLEKMRMGGVYDQIGFGFHRYSTDAHWLLPHFEKMLYDQAMLLMAYTEAYQITKKKEYEIIVREIIEYLQRDLLSEEGGFFSAEDADSEGEEGKFYVWSTQEIREILDDSQSKVFIDLFQLTEDGNFREEATREKTGQNIPHMKESLEAYAERNGLDLDTIQQSVEESRRKLMEVRENRIRPHLDDKILADWNGMVITALAKAARVFDDERYLQLAISAIEFINEKMHDKSGNLLHRYRDSEASICAFLDDYAFVTWALIELYQTTFNIQYLQQALHYTDILLREFWNKMDGGFFFTGIQSEEVLVRQMDAYDGAIPSGNSIAMYNLVRLGRMLGSIDLEDKANQIVTRFSGIIKKARRGFSMMLSGLDFAIGPTFEVVIAGEVEDVKTKEMLDSISQQFLPNSTLLLRGTDRQKEVITKLAPYTQFHEPIRNQTTAFICVEQNCKLPTTDIIEMQNLLKIT